MAMQPKVCEPLTDGFLPVHACERRYGLLQCLRVGAIKQPCGISDSIGPKGDWKLSLEEHNSCLFNECAISTLSNSVLLRVIGNRVLMDHAFTFKEVLQLLGSEFPPIIRPKYFRSVAAHGFDILPPLLDDLSDFTFRF